MPDPSPLSPLIAGASRAPTRPERDAAFDALLAHPAVSTDALEAALRQTASIVERRDRVGRLAVDAEEAARWVALLGALAAGDDSRFVREAAARGLVRAGAAGDAGLLQAFEAALERREPLRGPESRCLLRTVVDALCGAGRGILHRLRARILAGAPVDVGRLFVDRLVDAARWNHLGHLLSELADTPELLTERDRAHRAALLRHAMDAMDAFLAQGGPPAELVYEPDALMWSIARHGPTPSLRVRAHDAIQNPGLDCLPVLDDYHRWVRDADPALAGAACRVCARVGAPGIALLRAVAAETLPAPSPAWWVLVEADPEGSAGVLVGLPHANAMALLPGVGKRPAGAGTLAGVAGAAADAALRTAAVERLLRLGEEAHRPAVELWLALRARPRPVESAEPSPDAEVMAHLEAAFDRLLACHSGLERALEVLPVPAEAADRARLTDALCQVAGAAASLSAADCAGRLFHVDADERLIAAVGLCQHPLPAMAPHLVNHALSEPDPLVGPWMKAAAWTAVHAALDGPAPPAALLDRLAAADPALAQALRPPAEPLLEGPAAQLSAWLDLDAEARVEALIDLSRSHPGRKLTRVQARDLSRALTQPGRARRVVDLLLQTDRPGMLARALVLARRSGAGRSRQQAAAELDWTEAVDAVELEPMPSEAEAPEPDIDPEEDVDDWDTGEDVAPIVPLPPLGPQAAEARVLAPLRPDIAAVLDRFSIFVEREEPDWRRREGIQLRDALPPAQRDALLGPRKTHLERRWHALLPGEAPGSWPADRPVRLTDPVALTALGLTRDALWDHPADAPRYASFLGRCDEALRAMLPAPPPAEPDLSPVVQLLVVFAEICPDAVLALIEASDTADPAWHPLLLAACLTDPFWRNDVERIRRHDRPAKVADLLSRSRLAQHHRARMPSLLPVPRARRLGPASFPLDPGEAAALPPEPAVEPPPDPDFELPPDPDFELPPVATFEEDWRGTPMLAAGAWTPHRLDYPAFQVATRSGFSPELRQIEAQQRVARRLAVPALLRRLAEDGSPADLLRLVWSRDCIVTAFWPHARVPPYDDAPVDDAVLGEVHARRTQEEMELPPLDWEDDPPRVERVLTTAELRALPPDALRGMAHRLPPARRGLAWRVLQGLTAPGELAWLGGPAPGGAPSWWAEAEREAALQQVLDDARAYMVLRGERPGRERIARRTLRRFWRRPDAAATPSVEALRDQHGPDRLIEGLIQGLLIHMVDGPPPGSTARAADKQITIRTLRQLSLAWAFAEPACLTKPVRSWDLGDPDPWLTEEEVHAALRTLYRTVEVVPREVAVALGLTDAQGLPLLLGGARTLLERAVVETLSELAPVLQTPEGAQSPPTVFELRPLTKAEALRRGERAGDCSSSTVPFRCLSPHHTYYGVYRDGVPQRGYLTLFEAWLTTEGEPPAPTLVLETINIPIPLFDFVQDDLVHIIEAIAHQRGLAPRIAVVREWWAWNFSNRDVVWNSRMARGGEDARLQPADPCLWEVYRTLMPRESTTYSPFQHEPTAVRLAPTDPALDTLQPENRAEAARIRSLPAQTPVPTVWNGDAVVGFISALPEVEADAAVAPDAGA